MEVDQSLDLKEEHPFDRAVLYIAIALFALTVVLTTIQVFVRVFGIESIDYIYLTQPLSRITLIIGTYLGAAVAFRNSEHISIQFLLDKLTRWSPKIGFTVRFLGNIIVVTFLAIAIRAAYVGTIDAWNTSLGGAGFVMSGQVYLMIGVGLVISLVYEVVNLITMIQSARAGQTLQAGIVEGASDE
jgi:TRAP-type C4-dicarboxylate transport system permease small subunit